MKEMAYVNGVFGPIAQARVSIEDRGFQFGDGVYEVIATYGGRPFLLEPHMRRLRRSAGAIGLDYDFDGKPPEPIIAEGLRRSGFSEAMIYVQITRGAAPRSHVIAEGMTPTVVMTVKALPIVPEELRRRGAKAMTTRETRWAKCYVKAVTLLPNVLAKNEALRRGYDEAIFVTDSNEVRECTACNVFIATDGRITIPPRTEAILHGVTQGFLMECASVVGLPVEERAFDLSALYAADEVFVVFPLFFAGR